MPEPLTLIKQALISQDQWQSFGTLVAKKAGSLVLIVVIALVVVTGLRAPAAAAWLDQA